MARSKHLTLKDRHYIEVSLSNKRNQSQIAQDLKRSKSCISKEIRNNIDPSFGFL